MPDKLNPRVPRAVPVHRHGCADGAVSISASCSPRSVGCGEKSVEHSFFFLFFVSGKIPFGLRAHSSGSLSSRLACSRWQRRGGRLHSKQWADSNHLKSRTLNHTAATRYAYVVGISLPRRNWKNIMNLFTPIFTEDRTIQFIPSGYWPKWSGQIEPNGCYKFCSGC